MARIIEQYPGQIEAIKVDLKNARDHVAKDEHILKEALRRIMDYQLRIGYMETELSFLVDDCDS